MVNEGIVLGHKISERGIEVDKAKVDAIENMSCPKDCHGEPRPPMWLRAPFWFGGRMARCTKSGGA